MLAHATVVFDTWLGRELRYSSARFRDPSGTYPVRPVTVEIRLAGVGGIPVILQHGVDDQVVEVPAALWFLLHYGIASSSGKAVAFAPLCDKLVMRRHERRQVEAEGQVML